MKFYFASQLLLVANTAPFSYCSLSLLSKIKTSCMQNNGTIDICQASQQCKEWYCIRRCIVWNVKVSSFLCSCYNSKIVLSSLDYIREKKIFVMEQCRNSQLIIEKNFNRCCLGRKSLVVWQIWGSKQMAFALTFCYKRLKISFIISCSIFFFGGLMESDALLSCILTNTTFGWKLVKIDL